MWTQRPVLRIRRKGRGPTATVIVLNKLSFILFLFLVSEGIKQTGMNVQGCADVRAFSVVLRPETVRTVRNGESRTSTSTFTQLLSSGMRTLHSHSIISRR